MSFSGQQKTSPESILFTGVFFDKDVFYKELSGRIGGVRLTQTIRYPHVTFCYGKQQICSELFGKEVSFIVTGYGNDGLNEGLLVRLSCDDPLIRECFDKIETPHITISIGAYGRAVNTKYLDYEHVDPFLLTGTYGGMTISGQPITE